MKKTYMKPAIEAVEIEIQPLMDASMNDANGTGTISISTTTATGDGMSKETSFDLWGDDEE